VVLNQAGVPDFQKRQNALNAGGADAATLFLFDLRYLDGYGDDLHDTRLADHRLLEPLLTAGDLALLRYWPGDVTSLLAQACKIGLEGLIGKRAHARYRAERSSACIKRKCRRRQEFVIGGYTEPAGNRRGFSALLLGVYERAPDVQHESATHNPAALR